VVRRAVINGERMHFAGRQLLRNHTLLLVDIILAHALGEGPQLTFDVLGVLAAPISQDSISCVAPHPWDMTWQQ
jgi:hypothetical protein